MIIQYDQKGYTLIEVLVALGVGSIIVGFLSLSMLTFRDNTVYDTLKNSIVESVYQTKRLAQVSRLDASDQRSNYSIIFNTDNFIQFEGETYIAGAETNVVYEIPVGFELVTSCSPIDDGSVTFSPITGVTDNICTVQIYRIEQTNPVGYIHIGKYGVVTADEY